jgi:pimeloyl-ACP methyl ester carboxylesterase
MSPSTVPTARNATAEPLLLLHGLGTTHADFDQVIPFLADHFDVHAVDLPGQGDAAPLAELPTVTALADALERDLDGRGLAQVHILGNSLGARLALELASRGRARSVVALAPSGLSLAPERVLQLTAMSFTASCFRVARAVMPTATLSRHLPRAMLAGLRARPWKADRREIAAMVSGFGAPDFPRLLLCAAMIDVPTQLDRITCPVVLAQGSADLLAAGQTPRFLAQIPHATFRLLPCAGHAAQADVPELVAHFVISAAAQAV